MMTHSTMCSACATEMQLPSLGLLWAVFVNAGWNRGRKGAGIEVGWLPEWGLRGCGSASGLSNYGCGMAMVSWNLSGGLCDVMHGLFAKNSAGLGRVWVGWMGGMQRDGVVLVSGWMIWALLWRN